MATKLYMVVNLDEAQRNDLSPEKAAEAAEAVFQKLCIPQAPTTPPVMEMRT
jgi:hypothetical protein